jgi:hypothetical protein
MGASGGQIQLRAKQTLEHSAFQSLAKTVVASGKRVQIHQHLEVEINRLLSRVIIFLLSRDYNLQDTTLVCSSYNRCDVILSSSVRRNPKLHVAADYTIQAKFHFKER